MATLFSFTGDREEVSDFMQKGSHLTRVYFINASGLKGFLVKSAVIDVLKKAVSNESI